MPGECHDVSSESRARKKRLAFSTWNINGINDRIMGDKFDNPDFLSRINKFDFVVLTETWSHQTVHTPGFKCFTSTTNDSNSMRITKSGRYSGGVMIFVKNNIASNVSLQKSSKNLLWCQIDKRLTGLENHIFLCGAYIPPINSKYFSPEIFEELENDIADFRSKGTILLSGDFNSRTGKYEDYIPNDSDSLFHHSMKNMFIPEQRNNYDNVVNAHGKNLLQICKNFDLRILNGRIRGDSFGNIAYHGRLGVSTAVYSISDQSLFQYVDHLIVKSPTYFSDHSQILTWLKIPGSNPTVELRENVQSKSMKTLPTQFRDLVKTTIQARDPPLHAEVMVPSYTPPPQ